MIRNVYCIILLFSIACKSPQKTKVEQDEIRFIPKYATGFSLSQKEGKKVFTVRNPWQNVENIEYTYTLSSNADKTNNREIKIPIKRAICMSSSHIAFIDALDEINSVVGVSGLQYIHNKTVRERSEEGKVFDVGYDSNLTIEQIYALQPDVLFAYGVMGTFSSVEDKLNELGIKVVYIGDYLEEDPLGKAEWLIALSAFYNREDHAKQIFEHLEDEYNNVVELVKQVQERPKVMLNSPYKNVWYLPGGKSNMAKFLQDAGANYLNIDFDSRDSYPMNIEEAYTLAMQADYWIAGNFISSLKEIVTTDNRMANIPSFKAERVYNYNSRITSGGGSDFWESGVVNPQIILRDLVKIFHPELMPNHELYYFEQLH